MVNRFEKIEEFIEFDDLGQKVQRQYLASTVRKNLQENLPRVLTAFLLIASKKASGTKYPEVIKEYTWEPVHMINI